MSKNKKSSKNFSKNPFVIIFMALISLSFIVTADLQVDFGFRIEESTTSQTANEQQVVQDYSFRFNTKGSTVFQLEKESN